MPGPKKHVPMQLPLRDYERAFRVIHSVVEASDRQATRACILLSCAGAYLLKKFYNIPCRVVAGAALYRVGPNEVDLAVIGAMRDGHPFSDRENFHMWIQTETHAIDFQAPVFREAIGDMIGGFKIPRLMFQRGILEQCDGNFELLGDFDLFPNIELTEELTEAFFSRNEGPDLVMCCESWFTRPPKPIQRDLALASSDGIIKKISLSPIRLTGAWGR